MEAELAHFGASCVDRCVRLGEGSFLLATADVPLTTSLRDAATPVIKLVPSRHSDKRSFMLKVD